jgi:hypothetical protein
VRSVAQGPEAACTWPLLPPGALPPPPSWLYRRRLGVPGLNLLLVTLFGVAAEVRAAETSRGRAPGWSAR